MKNQLKFSIFLFVLLGLISCSSSKEAFSKKDIVSAQKLYGVEFSENAIDTMYNYVLRNSEGYDTMRNYSLGNNVFPAVLFDPIPRQFTWPIIDEACDYVPDYDKVTIDNEEVALMTVAELGKMLRNGEITSVELTQLYIDRIKKYDPTLKCVITLMEKDALSRARLADEELSQGQDRGPLHGIPYGVKDLVAVEGYPTTWGSMPYKNQVINHTATIVHRMNDAGAVLLAKLTSGALARGDVWWGGQTVNPWDTLQGASGSSAGSGSATSAGLVGFSIGTETLGSITSPSNRNGVTGLRPSYGRVSRDGVMSLSWSMDKVGPICRSAEDCLLVFQVIQGDDENDPTTYDLPFCYEERDISSLKIGNLKSLFEKDTTRSMDSIENRMSIFDHLSINMTEDSLPGNAPFRGFDVILRAESGAFFDELVRSGKVDVMVQQGQRSRANSLRQSRFIPAVEYLQANRHRRILIEDMHEFMSKYDVVVSPTFGGSQLQITNLTGHPVVTIPMGLDHEGHPVSITLIGRLFEEDKILQVAMYLQEHMKYDNMHPPLFLSD
ncbi:MAG: amidase [Saprospiraceae bacterium]|nr:amidase [Saprospiraceae bacterium]